MKAIFIVAVMACLAQSVAAQEPTAQTLLEHMPCRAWTIMHENDWSGQKREQAEVESWTVRYLRDYLKRAVARLRADAPEKDWKSADGSNVDDRQILHWVMTYCVQNPEDPMMKAAFLLHASFAIAPDRRQLPR